MPTVIILLQAAGSLFSISFVANIIYCMAKKKKTLSESILSFCSPHTATIILSIMVIYIPFNFYADIQNLLPDGTYRVDIEVKRDADGVTYLLPANVSIYTDTEIIEDRNPEKAPTWYRTRTYYVDNAIWPNGGYLAIDNEIPPDRLVEITAGDTDEVFFVKIPSKNIIVTDEEKLRSIGIGKIVEAIVVTGCAFTGIIFCLLHYKKRPNP